MPKGRGSNKARAHRRLKGRSGRGTQSGQLKADRSKGFNISARSKPDKAQPKYAPANLEGVLRETEGLARRISRRLFRRQKR